MASGAGWQQEQEGKSWLEGEKREENPLRFKLTKAEIIRHRKIINEIISTGQKIRLPGLTVFYRNSKKMQLGILITKRMKKAVERNQVKRYIREAYRLTKHKFTQPKQIIFLIKNSSQEFNFHHFKEIIEKYLINNHAK